MKLVKYSKSKKVIAIVMGIMISLTSGFKSQANTKYQNQNNNKVATEMKVNQNKSIGIKKRHTQKVTSEKKMAGRPMKVGATAYCNDPITSTGTKPQVGRTIAVDPKVIPYGTKVYIPQFDKVFIAEDCGSAIKGNRIDIYMKDYKTCMEWGYKDITIYILEE
jgi:3D (Asp-Asp-Asp) domain-containing protein